MEAQIGVSAAFGGRDAAAAGMRHFRALKSAAKDRIVTGFSYPELAFVLHVSGEISEYGPTGVDNLQVDRAGEYLSWDLVVDRSDCLRLADLDHSVFAGLILTVPKLMEASKGPGLDDFDVTSLRQTLEAVVHEYESLLAEERPGGRAG